MKQLFTKLKLSASSRFIIPALVLLIVLASTGYYFSQKQKSGADVDPNSEEFIYIKGAVFDITQEESEGLIEPIENARLQISYLIDQTPIVEDIYTNLDGNFEIQLLPNGANYQIKVSEISGWNPVSFSDSLRNLLGLKTNQTTEVIYYLYNGSITAGKNRVEIYYGLKKYFNDLSVSQEINQVFEALDLIESLDENERYQVIEKLAENRFYQQAEQPAKVAILDSLILEYPELSTLKTIETNNNWFIPKTDEIPFIDPYNYDVDDDIFDEQSSLKKIIGEKAYAKMTADQRKKLLDMGREISLLATQRKAQANQIARQRKGDPNYIKYPDVGSTVLFIDFTNILKDIGSFDTIWTGPGHTLFNWSVCYNTQNIYDKNKWSNQGLALFYNIYFPYLKNNYSKPNFTNAEKKQLTTFLYSGCDYSAAIVNNFVGAMYWSFDQSIWFMGGFLEKVSVGLSVKGLAWAKRLKNPNAQKLVIGGTKVIAGSIREGGVIDYIFSSVWGKIAIPVARGAIFALSNAAHNVKLQNRLMNIFGESFRAIADNEIIKDQIDRDDVDRLTNINFVSISKHSKWSTFFSEYTPGYFVKGKGIYLNEDLLLDSFLYDNDNKIKQTIVHEQIHALANKATLHKIDLGARGHFDPDDEGITEFLAQELIRRQGKDAYLSGYQIFADIYEGFFYKLKLKYGNNVDQALVKMLEISRKDTHVLPEMIYTIRGRYGQEEIDLVKKIYQLYSEGRFDEIKNIIHSL